MNSYLIALALVALPTFSNFVGRLLTKSLALSDRTLSLALHGGLYNLLYF